MTHLARKPLPGKLPFPKLLPHHTTGVQRDITFVTNSRQSPASTDRAHHSAVVAENINPFARQQQVHSESEDAGAIAGAGGWQYYAAFGGARRDEEKSRAKERIYSFRDRVRPMGIRRNAAPRAVDL